MLRRRVVLALFALSAALVPATARAQQLQIEVKSQLRAGERANVAVTAPVAVVRVHAELDHEGKKVTLEHGALRAGQRAQLALPGPGHYEGNLVATLGDGNRMSYELKFDIVVADTMKIGYTREHLDLDAHTLEFTLSRGAGHAELRVIGDDGKELATATADYKGERAGSWLPIRWTPTRPGNVLALELRATSTDGAKAGVRLVPWSVKIPHDEVVFETGKSEIRPSEEAKLDAGYKKIVDAVADVRKADANLPVKLFVAGHTDTVGSAADNRKLSLARARAIAAWYHERGLPLPIAFAGFGEDALRVKTPDETDNAANRRADYIVGVEEPLIARGVHASWMKLQ
ncbi:MAG: OmpA family protein [Myxococcales bacterium]|nr:OmpA family protein [Myxococcales bacterium]